MKSFNVLVVQKGYPLGTNAGDKIRTLNMAQSLKKMGYNVFFLGFYTRGLSLIGRELETFPDGIKPLFIFSLPNRFHLYRIAAFIRALVTWLIVKRYKIDIVQSELASAANCVRFLPHVRLVTDFHSDIAPELEMAGASSNIIKYAKWENSYALKRSDATITVSSNLRQNLNVYEDVEKMNYILPCNFDSAPFLKISSNVRETLRVKFGLDNRIVLCYSGGLHVWQCVSETIDLAVKLHKLNPAYFLCLFTNDNIEPYQKQLELLEGNYLVKSLEHSEMAKYLSMTDIGFVLRSNSLVNINCSPTKTSEYLAAGMMVIATRYAGDVPQLIKECECGYILNDLFVDEEEVQKINSAINHFLDNRSVLENRIKSYVFKKRTWDANEALLKNLYANL